MPEPTSRSVLWRNLRTPGHDAALLVQALTGWHLTGMAAFHGEDSPVAVNYTLEMDDAWNTKRGSIRGVAGGRRFFHALERTPDGWKMDGKLQGLEGIADLDFGFTPATNLQQLKRLNLGIGQRAELSVAWSDLGQEGLVELPQIYERHDATHYRYVSPRSGYEAMLEIDASGFIGHYPDLWEIEPAHIGHAHIVPGRDDLTMYVGEDQSG